MANPLYDIFDDRVKRIIVRRAKEERGDGGILTLPLDELSIMESPDVWGDKYVTIYLAREPYGGDVVLTSSVKEIVSDALLDSLTSK